MITNENDAFEENLIRLSVTKINQLLACKCDLFKIYCSLIELKVMCWKGSFFTEFGFPLGLSDESWKNDQFIYLRISTFAVTFLRMAHRKLLL